MDDPGEEKPAAGAAVGQENIDIPHRQGPLRFPVLRRVSLFALTLLAIEFLDELVFGVREAAWPLLRDDLGLTYAEVGLLLGVPNILANVIEPFVGILGDVWRRRVLVLGGGLAYGLALLLVTASPSVGLLLPAFILLYPASGAFVGLSQATLMDADPTRHEQNMARWTLAGSVGVVSGSLVVSGATWLGVGWRPLFAGLAVVTFAVVALAWRFRFPAAAAEQQAGEGTTGLAALKQGILGAVRALRRREVLRWLTLLEFSDFMLDVLLGFLALYFVDVVHLPPEQAALAVLVWTVVGLLGDFLLIPLLERVRGLSYLRISAVLELALYAAFLLLPFVWAKFALLALLGLFNAGWYSILKGQLYSAMPGQSGTVMAVGNVLGLVAGASPIAFGLVARQWGLEAMMWLLILGPVALVVGLPRRVTSL